MNFKTTGLLGLTLLLLALAYVWRPTSATPELPPESAPFASESSDIGRDVISPKLGDITKITCRREGREVEWVFEKSAPVEGSPGSTWSMTAPTPIKVVTWEVDRIARQLTTLQYEISHRPGAQGAVTAERAGLEPPHTVVTLTDDKGQSATVQIGRPASSETTFVRVAGQEDIRVGMASLRGLLKDKAVEYRDLQLWSFTPEKVRRLEIEEPTAEGSIRSYVLVRDGMNWNFEVPFTARATAKVGEMVQAFSRLRAMKWEDDRPDRLSTYGLGPGALRVTMIVEEEVPAATKKTDAVDPATGGDPGDEENGDGDHGSAEQSPEDVPSKLEVKQTRYTLEISAQSPIGENTKTYVRVGEEPAVATLIKTAAEKFKPVVNEWRDLHVTQSRVVAATRLAIRSAQGSANLVLRDGGWWFEDLGTRADDATVLKLLDAIRDLSAVTFVNHEAARQDEMGLDQPQMELTLTIPGQDEIERIMIGAPTDPASRLLTYVRRGESTSVAKVRTLDLEALPVSPQALEDKTVFNIPWKRIERIKLSRDDGCLGGSLDLELVKRDGTWTMTAPVEAAVHQDRVDQLAADLGQLRATKIVRNLSGESEFGLHAPMATFTFWESGLADSEKQETPSGESAVEEPNEPAPSTWGLTLGRGPTGEIHARRSDRPEVYGIGGGLTGAVNQEFRTEELLKFDSAQVNSVSLASAGTRIEFDRVDGTWRYRAEPDLPLNQSKIDDLLKRIGELKLTRYVRYGFTDWGSVGLDHPSHEITLTLEGGQTIGTRVSSQPCPGQTPAGFFAARIEGSELFLVPPETLSVLTADIRQFESVH